MESFPTVELYASMLMLVSTWLLSGIPDNYFEIVLSFGLATLLFLVTEELLVEVHKGVQSPLITAAFFAGFPLFMLLPAQCKAILVVLTDTSAGLSQSS